MKVCNLRFESMRDPVGIDITEPMLSWMVTSENRCSRQSAWQLQIFAETAADQLSLLHDTGIVSGDDNSMLLRGVPLLGYTVYHWKVRVWDEDGRPSDWSSAASFETGILCNSDWDDTHWVEPEQKDAPRITQDNVSFEMFPELHDEERFVPTLLLKQCFQSSNNVWKARAYVSAHGVYQFRLNGKQIGSYELSPEVTPYDKYLQYQTYDITDALRTGENTAAVHLAPGWWSGVIGLKSSSCQYGSKMAAIFRIVLFLRDGSRRIFCSGEDTMAEQGPYRYAELYMGEYFDSNLALRSGSPLRVSFPAYDKRCLRGQNAPHIHVVKTIACKRQLLSPKGEKILDFGEILAGKARLVLRARKHTAVRLHYFQQLDADGNYFLGVTNDYNQMTDTYVFHSDADECYEPIFVYHYNVEQFCSRFFMENRLEQHENGRVPKVVPMHMLQDGGSPAGWGDEVIIAPWEAYMAYGDRQILSDNYEMMQRWLDYVVRRMELEPQPDSTVGVGIVAYAVNLSIYKNWSPNMQGDVKEHFRYIWDADFQFGDWMVPSGNFDDNGNWTYLSRHNCESFVPCFYTAYTTELMAKIAAELGKTADAAYYAELNRKIREAVIAELYDTGYIPENEFQGILTLALKARLYPKDKRSVLDARLQDIIYSRDEGRINTGFTSMEHILFELVKGGHPETAYDLLFNERIPSFLYMIDHGATGIWETWRNIEEDGTVNTASYTQYAIGNVGKWLMAGIGGIYALEPGYRRIGIAPVIDPKRRITSANAQYETPNGLAATEWSVCEKTVRLKVQIPANTTAEIQFIGSDRPPLTVGSGIHQFEYTLI